MVSHDKRCQKVRLNFLWNRWSSIVGIFSSPPQLPDRLSSFDELIVSQPKKEKDTHWKRCIDFFSCCHKAVTQRCGITFNPTAILKIVSHYRNNKIDTREWKAANSGTTSFFPHPVSQSTIQQSVSFICWLNERDFLGWSRQDDVTHKKPIQHIPVELFVRLTFCPTSLSCWASLTDLNCIDWCG